MASQTIKKLAKNPGLQAGASKAVVSEKMLSPADTSLSGYTTFDRKAEEMRIFLLTTQFQRNF
jgi:hypothetical protein